MKRNDHIYIWVILGILFGFIMFLAGIGRERPEKDCSEIARVHSNVSGKDYIVCDGIEPTLKEIK